MLAVPKSWKTCFYMSCNMIADLRAFIPAEMKKHQEAFLGGRCQITEQEFFFPVFRFFSQRRSQPDSPGQQSPREFHVSKWRFTAAWNFNLWLRCKAAGTPLSATLRDSQTTLAFRRLSPQRYLLRVSAGSRAELFSV